MSEEFRATTQYGDFYGEIAIDGHDGPFHIELAKKGKMPSGCWPVGFSIFTLTTDRNGMLPIDLMVVRLEDYNIDVHENVPDQLYKLAREVDELKIYPVSIKIPFDELDSLIKRLSVKVRLRQIPQEILRVDYDSTISGE